MKRLEILVKDLRVKRSYKEQVRWEREIKNLSASDYKHYLISAKEQKSCH